LLHQRIHLRGKRMPAIHAACHPPLTARSAPSWWNAWLR
jgi:hypothetical protein